MGDTTLTARAVADALGRHVVRGVYTYGAADGIGDTSGPSHPELVLRFKLPRADVMTAYFFHDPVFGPCLTDDGCTLRDMEDAGHPVPEDVVRAIASPLGVRVDADHGGVGGVTSVALTRPLDAAAPGEDAMAFVACLLRVTAFAHFGPPARATPRRRSR